ncbi:MAG: IS5 family transposase, partial [Roseovarius sp.]|nr:IS5 family transposase [Roseovarius sp.]
TSKIVAVTDALGYLVRFVLLPGQAHDLAGMPDLLEGLEFGALIGDKAFDADWLVEEVERRGAMAVIPSKRNRKVPRDHDGEMYKWRHQVENFFAKIKEFRAIATRYDKTDVSYAAAIYLAAGVIAAK